ncbi:MAG: hypothetical protein HOP11_11125 [Saprospiraceae bacterium]|nr:hypothetical protein [Saprospiraceae bacterium]
MENKNFTDWAGLFNKMPFILRGLGIVVSYILKLPNYIWSLPGLSKLKGIRMLMITILGSIQAFGLAFDVNLLSEAICNVAGLFNLNCNPEIFIAWFGKIMVWIAAALAIEDKEKK